MSVYSIADFDGDIYELINALLGSCASLDDEDMSIIELEILDENIFNCAYCGWWCETSEMQDAPDGSGSVCMNCEEYEF
jgi:hypothetical protein